MSVPHLTTQTGQQHIAWIGGSVHHMMLDAAATDGRLSMFRSSMRGGAASPVHVHDREDETVYVLEGTAVVWAGDQRWEIGPGDTAFLPRCVPHAYTFTSPRAELITVCNPAGMEDFFRAAGWDLTRPQPQEWAVDMATMRAAADACGQRVLGPPLGLSDTMPPDHLSGETDD